MVLVRIEVLLLPQLLLFLTVALILRTHFSCGDCHVVPVACNRFCTAAVVARI